MNIKKIMLAACLLAAVSLSWAVVLKKASGAEDKKEQEALVEEADRFLGQKLYVRAIPLYEKSLSYNIGKSSIEQKLLEAYEKYGDMGSYAALVKKRVERGDAAEEECLTAARYYMDSRDLEQAMGLVKSAMEKSDSRELERFYEDNRYEYSLNPTSWKEITPTETNECMPAYDGKTWFYVDGAGRILLDGGYEKALPFDSDGYGVVKKDGAYVTVLENGDWYGRGGADITDVYAISNGFILAQAHGAYGYYNYDFECVAEGHQYEEITANACGGAAVKKDGKWGFISEEGETLADFQFEDVAVNSLGSAFAGNQAMVKKGGKWILVDMQGKQVSSQSFADARAPESGGYIAVADENGKWGFIDHKGNLALDYQYRDARSFSNQLAAVRIVDTWGYISKKGELVIEETFGPAKPFHNGRAQAQLAGYEAVVELSYFEEE